jgi:hypothetical protein
LLKRHWKTNSQTAMTHLWTRIFLLLALTIAFLMAWAMPRVNEDLFVALRSGRNVVEGRLTAPDETSFTAGGKIFVERAWISNAIYYESFTAVGDAGPVLLKGLLLTLCLGIAYWRCRGVGASSDVSLTAVTLGTLSLATFLGIRAENFGMLYIAAMAAVVNGPRSWGRWRQVGSVIVLGLWSNSHGTFVLGFGFIGLRALLDAAYRLRFIPAPVGSAESRPGDPLGWAVTLITALLVSAFANPFGPQNLAIPLDKLVGFQTSIRWNDYLPLLDWPSVLQDRFFKPFSVLPFLALIVAFGLLLVGITASLGRRGALATVQSVPASIDPLMELAMAGMMLPLVFKWQRLIIFSAVVMIPSVALVLTLCGRMISLRTSPGEASRPDGVGTWTAGAGVAVVVLSVLFYTSVVRLYLPGNPTSPSRMDRPLVSRLMSSHLAGADAVSFMKENGIRGRIFATFQLADYLLFHLRDIKVFFDLRAHAFYPFEVFDTYFSIIETDARSVQHSLELLKSYQVDFVVLDTLVERRALTLAHELMSTKQWGCIYRDDWVLVLAPRDSERFGPVIRALDLRPLRYPNDDIRLASNVMLHFFQTGTLAGPEIEGLRRLLARHPDPELYSLVVSLMNGRNWCLNAACKKYLQGEMNRLLSQDYMVAGGVPYVLGSLSRIASILEAAETFCGTAEAALMYRRVKEDAENKGAALQAKYSIF